MHKPSSRYLSRQPTILKGLSLNELCFVILQGIVTGALCGLVIGLAVGLVAIFLICGVLVGGFIGYFSFSIVLVRLKGNAPAGFLKKKVVIGLARFGLIQNPYTNYQGVWLKARKIKG
jgi:conjugative transfer region protein (TIGR03750 family)